MAVKQFSHLTNKTLKFNPFLSLMKLIHFTEAFRIVKLSIKRKLFGHKKYSGSPEEICRQIIQNCWNKEKKFFQTSAGHFNEFWTRDFGWCTEALIKLGYRRKISQTLDYALRIFQQHSRITTTISPKNIPFDFPTYSVDSLPWLMHSLVFLDNKKLIKKYQNFLNLEIKKFKRLVYEDKLYLVRPDQHFSSIKDYSKRKSSCYDNCLMLSLMKNIQKLGLNNPFPSIPHQKVFMKTFWSGRFFYDDLNKKDYLAGDAQVFPFYLSICKDKKMLASAIKEICQAKLDSPLPLKYTQKKEKHFIWEEFFVPNYEGNSIWAHLGMIYLATLQKFGYQKEFRSCREKYGLFIQKHQTFLEVYHPDGQPFSTVVYQANEGMLWSSVYLSLASRD